MVRAEKRADGTAIVDGENMVRSTLRLLRGLAGLAGAVKQGLQDCPRGSLPCIGLNEETLEAFAEIFRDAAAVQAALSEAHDAAGGVIGGDHGLASMEPQGRG